MMHISDIPNLFPLGDGGPDSDLYTVSGGAAAVTHGEGYGVVSLCTAVSWVSILSIL